MNDEDEMILVCAVRYALGRRSYMVGEAQRWIRDRWGALSESARTILRADVRRQIERYGRSLDRIDRETWSALLNWMNAHERGEAVVGTYVDRVAGTAFDLDEDLEAAGVERLLEEDP